MGSPFAVDFVAMLSAISFDNQSAFNACEIRDAAPDGLLLAKLESTELPIAEARPQPTLCVRRLAPQAAGMRIHSANCRHNATVEEEKPSPNPLPHAGEG